MGWWKPCLLWRKQCLFLFERQTENVFNREEAEGKEFEETREEAEINITQTETKIDSSNIGFPYQERTLEEPEDFSLRAEDPEAD